LSAYRSTVGFLVNQSAAKERDRAGHDKRNYADINLYGVSVGVHGPRQDREDCAQSTGKCVPHPGGLEAFEGRITSPYGLGELLSVHGLNTSLLADTLVKPKEGA
jgi:hypothetical protein